VSVQEAPLRAEVEAHGVVRASLDDPPILVHVGLHKTGTTWLQANGFRPNAGRALEYCETRRHLGGEFVIRPDNAFDPLAVRAGLAEPLDRARARGVPLVLQDEMLAALPFHQRFVREGVSARIARVFPRAKILVTIREQISVILSSWGHYIRGGHTAALRDFVALPRGGRPHEDALRWPLLDRAHFDYDATLSHYEARFGTGNVLLAPMEWMTRTPAALQARLSDFLGIEWPAFGSGAGERVVNPAVSMLAYRAMREANRFYPDGWKGRRRRFPPSDLGYWVNRATPASLERRMKARAREIVAAEIGDYYDASNARVAERIGLDLGALGYRVAG
jgi:hypothetical protein